MNERVYEAICKKFGHDWAFKDEETFITKICLNCGCEQYFFPEECEYDADLGDDNRKEN